MQLPLPKTMNVLCSCAVRGSFYLVLVFAASCTCGREISGSACDSANPCVQSTFSQTAGKCVDQQVTDGVSCDAGLECLVNTRCAAGVCVGEPRSCDDQNACTTDSCVEGQGCQHAPVACEADNPCHVTACNPASGCYDTSQTLPDGTACQLWWEPCVDDAACTAGVCDSPTADKEVPGQVRWQVNLDLPIGPFTIDAAGTSTFFAIPDGGQGHELFAIDACGKILWSSETGFDLLDVMEDADQLVAWGDSMAPSGGEALIGLDPSTGAIRWTLDLTATMAAIAEDAGVPDAGDCIHMVADVQLAALTDQHSVRAIIYGCDSALWSIDHGGHLLWSAPLPYPEPPAGPTTWGPVVDAAGNTYLPILNAQPCNGGAAPVTVLWEVSATGQTVIQETLPIWQQPSACQTIYSANVALGTRGVVVQPYSLLRGIWDGGNDLVGAGLLIPFDGGSIASLPLVNLGDEAATLSPLVDANGDIFMPGILSDAGFAGVTLLSATGEARWTSTAITLGDLVLSDDGSVFGLQANAFGGILPQSWSLIRMAEPSSGPRRFWPPTAEAYPRPLASWRSLPAHRCSRTAIPRPSPSSPASIAPRPPLRGRAGAATTPTGRAHAEAKCLPPRGASATDAKSRGSSCRWVDSAAGNRTGNSLLAPGRLVVFVASERGDAPRSRSEFRGSRVRPLHHEGRRPGTQTGTGTNTASCWQNPL